MRFRYSARHLQALPEMWPGNQVELERNLTMPTEAQKRANKNYRKKINRIMIDFSPAEAELWEHIQAQPNKQGYIKALIRADMKKPE